MKFEHKLTMKSKVHKDTIKKGIDFDKGQFDGLKAGEMRLVSKDEIIGKFSNGKSYIMLITGYERFDKVES